MAIHAYVGLPGSGKSYSVTEHVIIVSLKQDRHVVTNIPLDVDSLLAIYGGKITQLPHDWHEHADIKELLPPGCVAVLDECWSRWPSGQNINHARATDKEFLTQHRHRVDGKGYSTRVVLVTQGLQQLSSWVRDLVETTYRVRKITKKQFRTYIYNGPVTGDSPPKSKLVRSFLTDYKKEIFDFYKSATMSDTGTVGDESSADQRSNIFRAHKFWLCLFCIFVMAPLSLYLVRNVISGKAEPSDELNKTSISPVASVSRVKPEPPISKEWRLVGFVHPSKPDPSSKVVADALALIADANGNTRYLSFNHCRYVSDFTEAYCVIDGMKITSWSLKRSHPLVGGLIGGGG